MTAKPPLALDGTELAIVKAILARHVPDATVWVFGSRATGNAKKYSDLDLCIKANQALGLGVMSAMAEDFSESDLPWKVDVVDWFSVSDAFKAIIGRDKVLLSEPSDRL
jgi:type I restriction enzyme S subunit